MGTINLSDRAAPPLSQEQYERVGTSGSTGLLALPTITEGANGSITVGDVTCTIYNNPTFIGSIEVHVVPGDTFQLNQHVSSYLVIEYNGGSPQLTVTEDVNDINESDVIPVATCFYEASNITHIIHWDSLANGLGNKMNMRFVKTDRYGYESGLELSEDGTRHIRISAGKYWIGAVRHDSTAFDSSVNHLVFLWYDGTSWQATSDATGGQYNNTQYQGPSGLVALGNNEYGVVWVFMDADSHPHATYVLGQGSYKSPAAAAEAEIALPDMLPAELISHGLLVGRYIVQKNANTAASIDGAFEVQFNAAPINQHNNLAELQGGTPGEYYHLTFEDSTEVLGDLWDDVRISMARVGNGAVGVTYAAIGGGKAGFAWHMPGTAQDSTITFDIQMPHEIKPGEDAKLHLHWTLDTANSTDNVILRFRYSIWNKDVVATDATTIDSTIALDMTAAYHERITPLATIPGALINESTILTAEFYRLQSADTFTGDFIPLSMDFHIKKNKRGTVVEYPGT